MKAAENNFINTAICVPTGLSSEVQEALNQIIADINTNFQVQDTLNNFVINMMGLGDAFQVMCSATDTTPDYLHAKFKDPFTYATGDFIVYADLVDDAADESVRLAIDSSVIAGYSGSGTQLLGLSGTTPTFFTPAGLGIADEKVKCSAADTTAGYLHAKFKDPDVYATGDFIIEADLVDDASDENVRLFLDSSGIAGYTGSGDYLLGLSGTTPTFFEAGSIASGATYKAIRGLVKGDVTADDTTFPIDNVIPLASGTDPVSGNPATEVTVQNIQKEAFEDNTPITAIYDGAAWEVLLVERYRLVRGEATSATSSATFTIDNIKVLSSGVDPRSDPTSSAETLTVTNLFSDTFANNAAVIAAYNTVSNVWETISRGTASTGKIGKADAEIAARSGTTAGSGTVSVWSISGTTLSDTGNNETWYNISSQAITAGEYIQAKEINGQMVIDFEDCGS